jgi:peptide-methionine (S)-S-oxide reductase/peptide methionine sulfoxide reductase msrA/msrB
VTRLFSIIFFSLAACSPNIQKKNTEEVKMVPNPTVSENLDTAILAGGCFWGMEELLRKIPGVKETKVGYSGGFTDHPTYNDVKKGSTGHAEAVKITFAPKEISYEDLLVHFFKMHDPTTKNQQGNDIGSQYRSAIFYNSEAQKATAERMIDRVNKSGAWGKPVVTELAPAKDFTEAEDYHQDYLVKNPGGYTCHYIRKVEF